MRLLKALTKLIDSEKWQERTPFNESKTKKDFLDNKICLQEITGESAYINDIKRTYKILEIIIEKAIDLEQDEIHDLDNLKDSLSKKEQTVLENYKDWCNKKSVIQIIFWYFYIMENKLSLEEEKIVITELCAAQGRENILKIRAVSIKDEVLKYAILKKYDVAQYAALMKHVVEEKGSYISEDFGLGRKNKYTIADIEEVCQRGMEVEGNASYTVKSINRIDELETQLYGEHTDDKKVQTLNSLSDIFGEELLERLSGAENRRRWYIVRLLHMIIKKEGNGVLFFIDGEGNIAPHKISKRLDECFDGLTDVRDYTDYTAYRGKEHTGIKDKAFLKEREPLLYLSAKEIVEEVAMEKQQEMKSSVKYFFGLTDDEEIRNEIEQKKREATIIREKIRFQYYQEIENRHGELGGDCKKILKGKQNVTRETLMLMALFAKAWGVTIGETYVSVMLENCRYSGVFHTESNRFDRYWSDTFHEMDSLNEETDVCYLQKRKKVLKERTLAFEQEMCPLDEELQKERKELIKKYWESGENILSGGKFWEYYAAEKEICKKYYKKNTGILRSIFQGKELDCYELQIGNDK